MEVFGSLICILLCLMMPLFFYGMQVEQADGGERSAAINAATLALIDAGIPVKDIREFFCRCIAYIPRQLLNFCCI